MSRASSHLDVQYWSQC